MKMTVSDDKKSIAYTYTPFEMAMGQIFFRMRGGSTRTLHEQEYWPQIEELRDLAVADFAAITAERDRLRTLLSSCLDAFGHEMKEHARTEIEAILDWSHNASR